MSQVVAENVKSDSDGPTKNLATDELIGVMLTKLKEFKLAPSPLPRKVIDAFPAKDCNVGIACSYCGTKRVKISVPEVEFNLKARTATLLCHKAACASCYEVIDLKTLLNHITDALMKKKKKVVVESFDDVYKHFLKINNIKNAENTELQEVVSIATSLQLIYAEISWHFVSD